MNTLTKEKLEKKALIYLSKYSSSEKNLKDFLYRKINDYHYKVKKTKMSSSIIQVSCDNAKIYVDQIIKSFVDKGYLDDNRFLEQKFNQLLSKRYGISIIKQKLIQKGVLKDQLLLFLDNIHIDELDYENAILYAKKKKYGIYREDKVGKDKFFDINLEDQISLKDKQNDKSNSSKTTKKEIASMIRRGFPYEMVLKVLKEKK